MQVKITPKKCPKCGGILNHSLEQIECIRCGYTILKSEIRKRKRIV